MNELILASPDKLAPAAKKFLELLGNRKVVAFFGEMGAGKTTFIKAICNELGVDDGVSSPTFALVYEYHTSDRQLVYHFDFYRINKASELFDLGYEDYFYSGQYCFIEWPEKASHLIPPDALKVHFNVLPDGKRLLKIEE
ncbi:MAG: tRNA (adenosine(37)-N6)-threonylcarbamoyltransferase complex ATPase subunit type 1 TsaE [Bacteroidales bacterium]|nr:tRNA (adenosine(37)-N6)-threonylcarbamoyltransferase complex ATPase subunit type 1 TsaE [Bacteroidales bacterium]